MIEKCVPGAAVNAYRQMQAWGLIQSMLSQITSVAKEPPTIDELFAFIPLLQDALYKTLLTACQQTEHTLNTAQIKELLKTGLQAARLARKLARPNDDLEACWDAPAFEEIRQALASSARFKSSPAIQTLAKQFGSFLEPAVRPQDTNSTKKRKGDKEEAGEGTTENGTDQVEPRKKRKKVKKQLKQA
ncbi:DNA-directed DNA polymerase [Ceratobasidium sp. 428]|nr:DNA-directed DNA polymerase [Ceratobasidium sp. 428]